MSKLSVQEGVAVVAAMFVAFGFAPFIFSSQASAPNEPFRLFEQTKEIAKNTYAVTTVYNTSFEVIDFLIGDGAEARSGDVVYVHYTGQFEDGRQFDNSTGQDQPFSFTLGREEVIQGWDFGLLGMREGGTRRLVIPPELAYGDQAVVASDGTELIPANATLIFDVVLMRVDKGVD
tara:strand:+ start:10102 stop:10629 length:528 start_codon:yes stop_codon:yes gene_type:complete